MAERQQADTYTMAQDLIGTEFFYDDNRTEQAQRGEFTFEEYPERGLAYVATLRGLANYRRLKRAELGVPSVAIDVKSELEGDPDAADAIHESLMPHRQRLKLINNLEHFIDDYESGATVSQLRFSQHDVFHALRDFLNLPSQTDTEGNLTKAGHIKMPTGTGKTAVLVKFVEALHDSDDSLKSLVLVPSIRILSQTIGKDGKRGFSEFAPDIPVTTYYQNSKDLSGNVVVMTYQSFNSAVANGTIDKDFCDVVIYDEAHTGLGEVTQRNIKSFSQNKIAVGLTATPAFAENKQVNQILPHEIYTIGLRECIEKGYLAPVQAWLYKTSVEIDQDFRHRDFTQAELDRLVELHARNQKGVEFARSFVEQGMQGIISCVPGDNVRHPAIIADMLEQLTVIDRQTGESRRIVAQAIHGGMTEGERQDIYDAYEAGAIDVLAFVDLLVQGWDSEKANFLINLRPTGSPVFGEQRLGRILRRKDSGYPAQVVDFVDVTKKTQYTALHSLGEYKYVLDKVYGVEYPESNGMPRRVELPDDLLAKIKEVNLRKVRDITVSNEYKPEHSDFVTLDRLITTFETSEAALIFIADEYGMELATDDAGATVISEINRDKLNEIIKSGRFDWILHENTDAIVAFIEQRGQAAVENVVQAQVVEQPVNQKKDISHLIGYSLHDLITVYSSGEVDDEDLLAVVGEKAKKGQISTSEATRLLLSGDHPGIWGSIQKLTLDSFESSKHHFISMLNEAQQTEIITDYHLGVVEDPRGFECHATIKTPDGREVKYRALAPSKKQAQQDAAYGAIARLTGTNVARPQADITLIEQAYQKSADLDAKSKLNTYLQKNPALKDLRYQTEHVMGQGKYAVFDSLLRVTLGDEMFEFRGNGPNKKHAEMVAATVALQQIGERLAVVALVPRAAKFEMPDALADDPVNFLYIRSGKQKLKVPKFHFVTKKGTVTCRISVQDEARTMHTFEASADTQKEAKKLAAALAVAELGLA